MALGGQSLAGVARVAFETTGVGETIRDTDRVENAYVSSLRGMSDGAIKLQLAEERLQRSLKRGPGNYSAVARAELGVRRARADLRQETDRLDRSEDRRDKNMSRRSSSLARYTAGYVGTTGIILAIRSSLAASREEELVLGQTKVALEATGLSWERYASRIETVIRAQSRLGFDDEALLKTFGVFIRRTKDVDEALRLNALTADVARGRYIDLEQAQNIVLKASIGMSGQLRRLGLDVDKNASSTELLTFLTKNYGQAAEEASTTGIAAQDRLTVGIENTKEAIGRGLLPTVIQYTDQLTKWLDTAENQEKLQRRVNQAVEAGETIVRGIANAFGFLDENIAGPLRKLGILDEVVQAVFILGIVRKSGLAALAVKGIGVASALAGRQVAANSALMVGSLNGVTAAAGRAAAATSVVGAGGAIGKAGRVRGALSVLGLSPGGAIIAGAAAGGYFGLKSSRGDAVDGGEFEKLKQAARQGKLTGSMLEEGRQFLTDEQYRALRQILANRSRRGAAERPGDRAEGAANLPPAGLTPRPPRTGTGAGRRTLADIELDIARPGNEAGDLREKRSFIQRQIDALEARKNLNAKQKAKLASLYGDLASTQSQLDSIASEAEQKIADQREQAKADRDEAREQAATRLRDRIAAREETLANEQAAAELTKRLSDDRKAIRTRIAFYREMGRNRELEASERRDYVGKAIATQKELQDLNQKEIKAREDAEDKALSDFEKRTRQRDLRSTKKFDALSGFGGGLGGALASAKRTKGAKDAEKGITAEQVRSMQFEFLGQLQGTMNQLGGNLFAPGQLQVAGGPNPELYSMVHELRQQTSVLTGLASGVRQPGTKYAGTEIAYLFDGPTF